MKLNFSAPILDIEGKPAIDETGKTVTLGLAIRNAMLGTYADEQNLSGDDKAARFVLAMEAHRGGEADWKVEDVALLKKVVAKLYGPLVVGRVFEIVEPKPKVAISDAG